ncbi:MAG: hypothetical protein AAGD18_07050 [Actinomycetota bacterium]
MATRSVPRRGRKRSAWAAVVLATSVASTIGTPASPAVTNTSEIELLVAHPGPTHESPIRTVLDLSADGRALFFRQWPWISADDGDWLVPDGASAPESGALTRNGAELVLGPVVYDRSTGGRTVLAEVDHVGWTGASRDGSVVAYVGSVERYVESRRTSDMLFHVIDRMAGTGPIDLTGGHRPVRVAVSDDGSAVAWLSIEHDASVADGYHVNTWRRVDGQVWRSPERFVTDDLDVADDEAVYVIDRSGTLRPRGLLRVSPSGTTLVASDIGPVDGCAVTVTVDPPSLLGRYGPTIASEDVLWFRSTGATCELVQTDADGTTTVLDGDVSVTAPILRSDDGSVIAYHRGGPLSGRQVVIGHDRLDPTAPVVDLDTRRRWPEDPEYSVTFSDGAIVTDGGWIRNAARIPLLHPGEQVVATEFTGGEEYLQFTSSGRAIAYRRATHHGDLDGVALNAPIIDAVASPSGEGYWMVAADGGIFAFGDAMFHGSLGGTPLNQPVIGMAPTRSGDGYWLVASDGGVFAFGDARFHGSMGGTPLNAPVRGILPSAGFDGNGYLLVAADGGMFSFGDTEFYGSLGGRDLDAPIVGADAPTAYAYVLVDETGLTTRFQCDSPGRCR